MTAERFRILPTPATSDRGQRLRAIRIGGPDGYLSIAGAARCLDMRVVDVDALESGAAVLESVEEWERAEEMLRGAEGRVEAWGAPVRTRRVKAAGAQTQRQEEK